MKAMAEYGFIRRRWMIDNLDITIDVTDFGSAFGKIQSTPEFRNWRTVAAINLSATSEIEEFLEFHQDVIEPSLADNKLDAFRAHRWMELVHHHRVHR